MNNSCSGKEIRIALCKKCNFKCIFCHSEGLDRSGKDSTKSAEEILLAIDRAMDNGFTDITFTGGEPFLRYKDTIKILFHLNKKKNPPDLTFVTNGSIINNELIQHVKIYTGNIKFNVSLHSSNHDTFKIITQSKIPVSKVINNISKLVSAGIKVKINTVILNGISSGPENIGSLIDTAVNLGVYGLKFLELLVTPENRKLYPYFYSEEAISRELGLIGSRLTVDGKRTKVFQIDKEKNLLLEVTRLTCKLGCANCLELRDKQLDSNLLYYPCFIQSNSGIDIGNNSQNFAKAIEIGNKHIKLYAQKYGNDSPILVHHDIYVEKKEEVFFEVNMNADECEEELLKNGYKANKHRSFHLYYCQPTNPDMAWTQCKKVIKYGYDSHTPNKFEIIITGEEHEFIDEFLLTKRSYLTPSPVEIPAHDQYKAQKFMKAFGYNSWFNRHFHIVDYKSSDSSHVISLDTSLSPLNIKVSYNDLNNKYLKKTLKDINASPIMIPFTLWLEANLH